MRHNKLIFYLVLCGLGVVSLYSFLKMFLALSTREPMWLVYDSRQQHTLVEREDTKSFEDIEKTLYWKYNGPSRKVLEYDCRKLIEGEENYVKEAIDYTKNHPRKPVSNNLFFKFVENCTEFKLNRGYNTHPLSQEEATFPIAYSILFYKDIQQVERLLRAIYQPQNIYCLHMDAYSSELLLLAAKSLARCFDNVFIASKLEKVVYAGFSRLQADLNCMKDVLLRHQKWKYYINLASQVFPLKTNYELVRILQLYNGSNDIEGIDGAKLLKGRFTRHFELVTNKPRKRPFLNKTSIAKSDPPHGIKIVRGSAYGVFSREFVSFVLFSEVSRDLLQWSKDTYSPDEHFWATLHHLKYNPKLKTPGGYTGDPDKKPWNAVYAAWGRRDIDPCFSGHFVHGVCIFGLADLPHLISRKEFFANKFHINYQYLALDCLEEWLFNKTKHPPLFDSYYYRRLPFINSPILQQPTRKPKTQQNVKIIQSKKQL